MDSEKPFNSQETLQSWSKLATLYADVFMDLELYQPSYDKLLERLKDHSTVLELGSGPGVISKYLQIKRNDLDILGTDVSPEMVEEMQRLVPEIQTGVLDARNVDQLTELFDCIVSGFVIPYLSQDEVIEFLNDSTERLTNNGFIYISFVPGTFEKSGVITGSTGDRMWFNYYPMDWISNQLDQAGFTMLDSFKFAYPKGDDIEQHVALIAQKKG